jgi:ribosomal protein S18 acetylase RimI-like enzyme
MQEECEGHCLVAYIDDVPAGFIFGYAEDQDDSRFEEYTGKQLYVADGYVVPEYRRMGIYKMLNSLLELHFAGMGVKRITRFTMHNNDGMRGLLEKEGYVVTRVLYEKWL